MRVSTPYRFCEVRFEPRDGGERHVRDTSESRRGHEGRGRHEPIAPPDMTLLAAMARSAKATLERRPRHLRDTC